MKYAIKYAIMTEFKLFHLLAGMLVLINYQSSIVS